VRIVLTHDWRCDGSGPDTIAMMQSATLAMSLARGRIAIGLAAMVAPGLATRAMSGRQTSEPIGPVFARMLGARDVALGLGTVIALDRGKPVRGWLEGSALSDTVDCLACVLAREHIRSNVLQVAGGLGAGSAIVGFLLSRRLDPAPPAHPGQPEAVATGHPDQS
jgi:hypothetical protein